MSDFFGQSSAQVQDLRNRVLETPSTVCIDRARIITDVYRANEDKQVIIKRALAMQAILEKMPIFIDPCEMVVGNQASSFRAAPVFPEYAVDWIVNEIDEIDKRPGDRFYIDEDKKPELLEICEWWRGKTLKDKALATMSAESRFLYDIGMIKAEGNITSGDGHIAADFSTVLKEGITGVRKRAEERLNRLDIARFEDYKKQFFLQAVLIMCDAVVAFARRFADLAESQAAMAETTNLRREQLLRIAANCRNVPENPAGSFYEAVQSVWFIQLILQIESNGHSTSFGRLDQYLYPYYAHDLAAGRITENEATELLEYLWIKAYTINKIRAGHTPASPPADLCTRTSASAARPQTAGMPPTRSAPWSCAVSAASNSPSPT